MMELREGRDEMPVVCGYKFRGIQEYIARGGRLIDIAGGSELIDSLCRRRLADVLGALGVGGVDANGAAVMHQDHGRVLQAASGRILLLFKDRDAAHRFVRLWPLIAEQWAPDARHGIDLREASDAAIPETVAAVVDRIECGPELPLMVLPSAGPLTMRERRTGLPVSHISRDGEPIEDRDASSRRRSVMLRGNGNKQNESGSDLLKKRFGFGDRVPSFEADDIADAGGSDILAVVHADGTRFGQRFALLMSRHGPEAVAAFSSLSSDLFRGAATYAVQTVMDLITKEGRVACRPILLGGDDMTVLVPGKFGLDVARRFLVSLEQASAAPLKQFAATYHLDRDPSWQGLHAGAGVALVHAHYPFDLALRLASTCAAWAKARLPTDPTYQTSSLQFHVALDSATDDYDDIFRYQLRKRDASELTAGPYITKPIPNQPFATLEQLDRLTDAVAALPRRGWRAIARLVHEPDAELANRRFRRQLELLDEAQRDVLCDALAGFGNPTGLWSVGPSGVRRTPVQDVDVRVGLERRFAQAEPDERDDADE